MLLSRSGVTGTLTLETRRFLTIDTFEIGFRRPANFEFRPGQRIELLHGNLKRDYSIISNPADSRLSFCIRLIKEGKLSVLLSVMPIGTAVSFIGPQGHFMLRPSPRPVVFSATGTGIAPFVSMVRSGIRGFTLLHGIRDASEAYFSSLFRSAAQRYIPCISGQPLDDPLPPGAFPGRVTDYLDHHLPKGVYDFYLSGRGEMIRDAMHIIDRRFPDSLVFTEIFY